MGRAPLSFPALRNAPSIMGREGTAHEHAGGHHVQISANRTGGADRPGATGRSASPCPQGHHRGTDGSRADAHLVFHITLNPDGTVTVTFES